jgi:hypothetical protein
VQWFSAFETGSGGTLSGGVRPGVDLDDSAALLDLMEHDGAMTDDAPG